MLRHAVGVDHQQFRRLPRRWSRSVRSRLTSLRPSPRPHRLLLCPPEGRRMPATPLMDDIRQELVARIRLEILAGTYDTQDKWEAALERLLDNPARDDD